MDQEFSKGEGSLEANVNGEAHRFGDPVVLGREILTEAGFVPATEHVLILVHHGRSRLIGPDDKVDLRELRGATFHATESDRTWSFTLNEIGQVWGAETMDASDLRKFWQVGGDRELVLEREDQPDVVLTQDGVVSFAPGGVEHLVTRHPRPGSFVLVSVTTTSGVFPAEGALRVRSSTPISEVIERARIALGVAAVTDWIVTVGTRDIDGSVSFEAAGLTGSVDLTWGPREGGGGA